MIMLAFFLKFHSVATNEVALFMVATEESRNADRPLFPSVSDITSQSMDDMEIKIQ